MQSLSSPFATILKPHQGKTFFFLGNTVIYKFNPNEQGSRLYEIWATAGSKAPPLHTHPWSETFYFLEGTANVQVENQLVHATPGYVIQLPAGVAHTMQITSPAAKFLVAMVDAAAARYIDEIAEAAQRQLLTPEDIAAIAQRHRIQMVDRSSPHTAPDQ